MSFYLPHGADSYVATPNTIGPWHPTLQHAGPPSALLGRAIEQVAPELQVVRFSIDLLKPVPVARLRVETDIITPGKRRQIIEARLYTDANLLVARARGLLLRPTDLPIGDQPTHDGPAPIAIADCECYEMDFFESDKGYHKAMDMRLAAGGVGTGRTQMWMRQRALLVAGEMPSPLQRLLVAGDSGNGVSMVLDIQKFSFANADLTINIRRPPAGEWLCLDAHTHCQANGLGMAESRLWDQQGVVANGTQNLLLGTST